MKSTKAAVSKQLRQRLSGLTAVAQGNVYLWNPLLPKLSAKRTLLGLLARQEEYWATLWTMAQEAKWSQTERLLIGVQLEMKWRKDLGPLMQVEPFCSTFYRNCESFCNLTESPYKGALCDVQS
jgi:hypothetical protein